MTPPLLLCERLHALFPRTPIADFSDMALCPDSLDQETHEIYEGLRGKAWDAVDATYYDTHWGFLHWLTPRGQAYYLAGALLHMLEQYAATGRVHVMEVTLEYLFEYEADTLLPLLSEEQLELVIACCKTLSIPI